MLDSTVLHSHESLLRYCNQKRVLRHLLLSQVDLRHKDEDRDVVKVNTKTEEVGPPPVIDVGIDLSEFYMSVEWDILQVHYC